jgi:hypothetical protein
MPNLRRLEFISCPRCERGWEDASIMSLLRHFYNPSAPKEVSIHGLVVHSDGMEGLGGIGFLEVGSLDEDRGPWSYMRRNMLTSLDIKVWYYSHLINRLIITLVGRWLSLPQQFI